MSLLSKLVDDGKGDNESELQSIIDNLNNIFVTKRDYGCFLKNYGISDYHHLSSADDIALLIIHDVTQNIEHFEPRLKLISIISIIDDRIFRLSFRINCLVQNNQHSLNLFLDSTTNSYHVSPS